MAPHPARENSSTTCNRISAQEAQQRLAEILDDGSAYTRALRDELFTKGINASPAQRERLAEVDRRSNEEAQKGHAGPPMTLEEVLARYRGRLRPLRRFGVPQSTKVRLCDDGRASRTNEATRLVETIFHQSLG